MAVRVNKRKLEQMIRTTPERASQMVRGMSTEIVGDIVLSFGTSPPGETYQRGDVVHVASQPGYPPNVNIGALTGSIQWTPAGSLKTFIHDGVIYGLPLEIGTDNMAARPFFGPVFEEWRQRKFAAYARDFGVFR